jgi:hypothetical protein
MRSKPVLALTLGAFTIAAASAAHGQQTVGLFLNDENSFEGYTLFAPLSSDSSYLIDHEGKQINSWVSAYLPGVVAYLTETGHLLRTALLPTAGSPFLGGGQGGRVEEFAWDGSLFWEFEYSSDDYRLHHDLEVLPGGNILMIAWEYRTAAEAIAAGRDPTMLPQNELWPEHVIEVEPVGMSGGNIVWEWHVWDHLIQDFDPTKDNFGVVRDHPELVDINFGPTGPDWLHVNAIDYNRELDQILLSVPFFSEIWVIDHSTTTAEAAGHTGGNSGRGGDLLYRWGNPQAYRRGTPSSQKLFRQHDAQWIEPGLPGEGNVLVFNNGVSRPGGNHSSVDEIVPPVGVNGNYLLLPGSAYQPTQATWSYTADPPGDFFAPFVSGAQRLPNGNTLICNGPAGTFFEVESMPTTTVWLYVNPVGADGPIMQGDPATNNAAFRSYRYPPEYPGLAGQDLTPGDPVELFNAPIPVPDGAAGTEPLTASRLAIAGDEIRVGWDASTCTSDDYHLIFGSLADVSTYTLLGSECALGVSGVFDWTNVPSGDLFFLIVGVDDTGVYESSWGADGDGDERNATAPSNTCGTTNKVISQTCL